jgi:hypothetical protein
LATTSKYFVLTPSADNQDFLDFKFNYGSVTTAGESIQYFGSSKVDSVFVRPGLSYDLSNTAGGTDKIYFTGNLADYTRTFDSATQTFTLTSIVDSESVKVSGGTPLAFDNLVFAYGTVGANALYSAISTASALPVPSPAETSLAPLGAAAPGAALSASIKAFSINTTAVGQMGETFASTKPGISLTISGGNGIDTVYVADGEVVDATVTGASVDLIYMRGTWADYTKSVISGGTKLLFTRLINGNTESVTVTAGSPLNYDRLIFADGTITTIAAKELLIVDPTSPGPVDPSITTPLYTTEEVQAAINATNASSGGWATTLLSAGLRSNGTAIPGVGNNIGGSGDVNGDGLGDYSLFEVPNPVAGLLGGEGPEPRLNLVIYGDTGMSSLALNPLIQSSLATGTTAAERLIGTSGSDTLFGGGGADASSAGSGNDTVLNHDASFLHLDGGLGTDTLKLDATAGSVNLDFTANGMGGRVVGFEGIDLTGGGNNRLKLTV